MLFKSILNKLFPKEKVDVNSLSPLNVDFSRLLSDRTNVWDIASIRFNDREEFKAFLSEVLTQRYDPELVGVVVYTVVNNLKEHPEFFKVLYRWFVKTKKAYLSSNILCAAVASAAKHGFISVRDAIKVAEYAIEKDTDDDYTIESLQRIACLDPNFLDFRIKLYRFMQNKTRHAILSDMIEIILKDYPLLEEYEKLPVIKTVFQNDKNLDAFSPYTSHDSYLDLIHDLIVYDPRLISTSYGKKYIGILPPDKFSILLRRLKLEDARQNLLNYQDIQIRFLGFLAGVRKDFRIRRANQLDDLVYLIPCLDEESYWKTYKSIYNGSTYCTILLNNSAITSDKKKFLHLLTLYLKSPVKKRKLGTPLIPIDSDIIDRLSSSLIRTLITRSLEWSTRQASPYRFTFTKDAVKAIQVKITPLLVAKEIPSSDFEDFLSVFDNNKTNSE